MNYTATDKPHSPRKKSHSRNSTLRGTRNSTKMRVQNIMYSYSLAKTKVDDVEDDLQQEPSPGKTAACTAAALVTALSGLMEVLGSLLLKKSEASLMIQRI